mgnify:CR=1 FL=1
MTTDQLKKTIERKISAIVGREVELTIRSLTEHTFSFDGRDEKAEQALVEFFKSAAMVSSRYDAECDLTCVYVQI